jgi:SNF2 family DNA or RNA helicase
MQALELKPHQIEGIDILVRHGRFLLADKAGLGKTATVLKAVEKLQAFPALVLAPKNALGVWESEAEQWLDMPVAIYSGPPKWRKQAWLRFVENQLPFLVANYAFIEEISKLKSTWPIIIADEIHLAGLLNHKSQTFRRFKNLLRSKYLFLVTGSPMRKNPADLYAPLHLIAPKDFPSYWKFVYQHCVVIEEPFGKTIEPLPKNPTAFRAMVKRYMLRRSELPDLPPKQRFPLPIIMTPKQEELYIEMAEEMIAAMDNQIAIAPNPMVRDMRLRQLLVSPLLLGFKDKGAILETLPEFVWTEYREDNAVAVFTPFREAVPLIVDELKKVSDFVGTITGGMSYKAISDTYKHFQSLSTKRKAIVCTIASSTSFTIHEANVAYFAGCEWDFNMNEQAEKRIHREGQKKNVRIYYMMHRGTIDEHVIDIVINKKVGIDVVLSPEHLLPINYKRRLVQQT